MITSIIRLWEHIDQKFQRRIVFLLFLMIIGSGAEILSIGSVVPFLTALSSVELLTNNEFFNPLLSLLPNESVIDLKVSLLIIFIALAATAGCFRFFLLWFQTRLSYDIGASISSDMYSRFFLKSYRDQIATNSSEIVSLVTMKSSEIVHLIIMPSLVFINSIFIAACFITVVCLVRPYETLILVSSISIVYGLILLISKERMSRNSQAAAALQTVVVKEIQEGIGGIRDIIINRARESHTSSFSAADAALKRSQANIHIIAGAPRFFLEILGIVAISFFALYLSLADDTITSTVPLLGALALIAQRLLPACQAAFASLTLIRGGDSSLRVALSHLEEPVSSSRENPLASRFSFQDKICLEGVSFGYSQGTPLTLRDVTFEIPKGSMVGIVGRTGSGKSTLQDILMGLLPPTSGEFLIDGVRISDQNVWRWHECISHVPQNIYLLDTSIERNIVFGCGNEPINESRLSQSISDALLTDVIDRLPNGVRTLVGERGIKLSGGQRQRIGIARALYKSTPVLFLDEATSALDLETEKYILSALSKKSAERTIFIIAHREYTLRNCNIIINVSNGTVHLQDPLINR